MFSNDDESIDQGDLLKMKKDFISIVDVIDTDEEYYINYSGIGLFGILAQILQALGIYFDPKIPLKYEKVFLEQKYTYTKFFSSLESFLDPCIEPSVLKSLEIIDELGFHELSPTRITLKMQAISFNFMNQNQTSIMLGLQKVNELVVFLKSHEDKYDFCKARLFQCYSLLLPLALNMNDKESYMKYIKDYINLGMEYSENKDILHNQFITYIPVLLQSGQFEEAFSVSDRHIKYLKSANPTKLYCEAIKYRILIIKTMRDLGKLSKMIPEYLKITEKVHTRNSPEYLDAKKEQANCFHMFGRLNEAYKECLEAYDISKEVYGSEKNIDASDIFTLMAIIKARLNQLDEAQKFLNKSKEIEEEVSSVYSERYKSILQIENQILQLTEKDKKPGVKNRIGRRFGKKRTALSKIAPNTPLKIGLYSGCILVIGGLAYWYYQKDK